MIPVVDIEVDPTFPAGVALGLPPEDEIDEEGYGFFRGVWDIGAVSHEEAVTMVKEERLLASLVDLAASAHTDFEAIASALEANDPDCLPAGFAAEHPQSEIAELVGGGYDAEPLLGSLELGVAGLSYALTSVGCFTAASCRSHLSHHSWSERPIVYFAAERPTVHWLTPLVRDTGCGFGDGSGHGRLLFVEAPSIANFMDLADRIVSQVERQSPRG
ncbi:hypothetical protein [Streptomyces sp. MB09-02B]|uniref:hypothetical protein n=1 Tax=Streptomyces sp. MB09-02B TaxID=3028667 RepID=UPI0029B081DE|nr:hypothetical protein [Streptomyces sp. MB09-02B]MDX3638600.1 hypothetical protein [Streptomyces sp. MB09-02B]